jgi:hypothetical protein
MDYIDRVKNQATTESPEIEPETEPSGDMPTSRKQRKSGNLTNELRKQMSRKLSSTESGGAPVKSYRLITGGEDSQLCFWRFDRPDSGSLATVADVKQLHEEVSTEARLLP